MPWRGLRPRAQPPVWLEPGLRLPGLGVPEKGPVLPVLQGWREESRGRAGDKGPDWTQGRAGFTRILEAGPQAWAWVTRMRPGDRQGSRVP